MLFVYKILLSGSLEYKRDCLVIVDFIFFIILVILFDMILFLRGKRFSLDKRMS